MDVLEVLEKNKSRKLTSSEIAGSTTIVASCVRRILKALKNDSSVNLMYEDLTFEEKKAKFGHVVNPNVRVYWIEN